MAQRSALFENAHDTRITHSSITATQTTNIYNSGLSINERNSSSAISSPALAKLAKYCAFGAFLNSSERPDPPRCRPQTRVKLLVEAKGWAKTKGRASSVMWLTGSAGSGKTAIAQTTAEELKDEGLVLVIGCHFFFRTSEDGKRSDGRCWVPNLVDQMVRVLPETRPVVEKVILENQSLFDQQPDGVLKELFLEPLLKAYSVRFSFRRLFKRIMGRSTYVPCLVVVDGLDECNTIEMQEHLLKTIAKVIPSLPIPVRFLIASRPETHIRTAINREFRNVHVHRINLDQDQDIRKDLEEYYRDRFNAICLEHSALKGYGVWPSREEIDILISKSSQFIFANTVMNYIGHRQGHPVERLEVILGLSMVPDKDKPYLPLDTLYGFILLTVEDANWVIVRQILAIIYAAGKPDFSSSNLESSPKFLERLLGLRAGKVFALLDPLVSILTLPGIPTSAITMLHASFFDYLIDPSRSGDMSVNAYEAIATGIFDGMDRMNSWKLYGTSRSLSLNVESIDYFLHHASKASMSQDLMMKLYALQDNMAWIVAFDTHIWRPYEEQLRVYGYTISQLLDMKSTETILPTSSTRLMSFALLDLDRHRREMACMVAQLIYPAFSVREAGIASLMARLRTGIEHNRDDSERLSGELYPDACAALIRELVVTHKDILLRTEFLDLLRNPAKYFTAWNWDREFANCVVDILESASVSGSSLPRHSIEEIVSRWAPYRSRSAESR
ncbi:hypothetical protein CPB83DRAFT_237819 [Crepidotus variabilis]|uniref:NACHT domain-containing protein n=1 Tax=Crepidotus variabilis TaxID=179855 RepID=A0A9P6JR27_9AGAR|nr:hypothetical protein CPB83DRAFT_237819 [Crepidotus variabilis]